MTVKLFVDTNVLVYCRDASERSKQECAMRWMAHLWETHTGCLSYQVLREYYVTVTDKLRPGLDRDRAREDVRSLLAWRPIPVDGRVIEGAWLIQNRCDLAWWDALIVAAAQVGDCRYLLTEDLQEDQKLGDLQVINPFHRAPASVCG